MNDLDAPGVSAHADPYGELYIYYLQGTLQQKTHIKDPAFIGNWEEDGYSFLFYTRPALSQIEILIDRHNEVKLLDQFQMSYEDWHGGPLLPVQIGRIKVIPPWWRESKQQKRSPGRSADAYDDAIEILLDPGVVFGTGTHPTTHHCIEAIQMVSADKHIRRVVDLGTGTGLLAIIAAKLGCELTLAVDLNRLAAITAQKNIHLNQLENRILAIQGSAENFVDFPSDLVISNIHYDVMKRLIRRNCFSSGQSIILSGLLRSQTTRVERQLEQVRIKVLEKWEYKGIWYTYLGRVLNDPG